MKLSCPQCGHTSEVTCATGCCNMSGGHLRSGALVCTKCSAVNRLDRDQTGNWTVRIPEMSELDKLLARPDIMIGLEQIRRAREARA